MFDEQANTTPRTTPGRSACPVPEPSVDRTPGQSRATSVAHDRDAAKDPSPDRMTRTTEGIRMHPAPPHADRPAETRAGRPTRRGPVTPRPVRTRPGVNMRSRRGRTRRGPVRDLY